MESRPSPAGRGKRDALRGIIMATPGRGVPVPVRGAEVPRVVVPGTAAEEPKATAFEVAVDPPPPVDESPRVVGKQDEVVHVAEVALRPQDFLAEVVEPVQVHVGEELAREVSDRQPPPPLEGREQVVARIVEVHPLLRVRAVDDRIGQRQGARAGETPPEVALQDRVVDGREVAVDVAAEHVPEAVAELLVAGDGPVRPLPDAVRVAVVDEAPLEDRLADLAEGVVHDPVAERRGRDEPVLRVEHLDDRVTPRPVHAAREFAFEAEDLSLEVREEGGDAGFRPLPLRRTQRRRPERGEGGDRPQTGRGLWRARSAFIQAPIGRPVSSSERAAYSSLDGKR